MKYKVFVEGRDIVYVEADNKEQARIRALTQAWDESSNLEWTTEVVEEKE